jgi:hypothetical protein
LKIWAIFSLFPSYKTAQSDGQSGQLYIFKNKRMAFNEKEKELSA